MIRTSRHNINEIANQSKLVLIDSMFDDYKKDLILYINYIIDGIYPLKRRISSKDLITENLKHSKYKRDIYRKASEIIRSQIKKSNGRRYNKYKKIYKYFKENHPNHEFTNKKYSELNLKEVYKSKYFTKPNINNLTITLTNEFIDIKNGNHYDNFIKVILPYFNEKGTRAINVKLPLKQHRHSNKFKENGFKLKNTIQIKKINNKYFINLMWEKEEVTKKLNGKKIGIDLGVKKLITTSDGDIIGDDMIHLYEKICNKQRNSKNHKQSLIHRDNLTNYYVNQLDLTNVNEIHIEELKNLKYKTSYKERKNTNKEYFRKDVQTKNNKTNSLWIYPKVVDKIKRICEEKGITVVEVPPQYTSQTCSSCGHIDSKSRNGENYKCVSCGYEIDADVNASINISNRGISSSSDKENNVIV